MVGVAVGVYVGSGVLVGTTVPCPTTAPPHRTLTPHSQFEPAGEFTLLVPSVVKLKVSVPAPVACMVIVPRSPGSAVSVAGGEV